MSSDVWGCPGDNAANRKKRKMNGFVNVEDFKKELWKGAIPVEFFPAETVNLPVLSEKYFVRVDVNIYIPDLCPATFLFSNGCK
jgi:hypothetical protein